MSGLVATAALVLALGAAPLGPSTHVGYVVYYNPGVMEGRALAHDAPAVGCYVAYTLAHDQDMARLWVQIAGPRGTVRCLVVDLPDDSQGDRERLIGREVWAELGWPSRWICPAGWTGRARDCRVRIWVIPDRVTRRSLVSSSSAPGVFWHWRRSSCRSSCSSKRRNGGSPSWSGDWRRRANGDERAGGTTKRNT